MMLLERYAPPATLTAMLDEVRAASQGRLVLVQGEAGVGKTALLGAATTPSHDGAPAVAVDPSGAAHTLPDDVRAGPTDEPLARATPGSRPAGR